MPRPKKSDKQEPAATPTPVAAKPTTPTKPSQSKIAGSGAKFDIFASENKIQQTKEALAKVKLADGFKSASEIHRDYLPFPWFGLQYLTGRIGVPVNTIFEVLGPEGVGKSSLIFSLLAHWTNFNTVCLYINSEPKMLDPSWISRLAGSSKEQGEKIQRVIEVSERINKLDDMDMLVRQWVRIKRYEQGVPREIPLVIAIDTITKMMNHNEAEVAIDNRDHKALAAGDIKGMQDVGNQPGVTAKWLHAWSRNVTSLLNSENVTLILGSGQNVNMNAGAGFSMIPESMNNTKTGGKGINQSAAFQIIITQKQQLKRADKGLYGAVMSARVHKNSYGPKRTIQYELHNDYFNDTATSVDQAVDMDATLCDILAQLELFGMSCTKKRYTSVELGIVGATAAKAAATINGNPELVDKIGKALKIHGYEADNA